MISGTWGIQPRYRFIGSRTSEGDGEAIVYVRGDSGRMWVVILPDGETVPSLVPCNKLEFKQPTGRWFREPK